MAQPLKKTHEFVEKSICPVNSYNEWDPLEEIIVGHLDGAVIPPYHISTVYNIPRSTAMLYRPFAGRRYPGYLVNRAKKELEEFVHILESEGVTVRRPDKMDFSATTKTPYWSSKGFCVACPRDTVLIVGDEIIETPTAWRCRHFEMHAYRSLFKEYFRKGARWTAAPRPQLLDDLYVQDFKPPEEGEPVRYLINEFEPVFDAADFARCGRDIFYTKSNVTNDLGVEWLRRHLGDSYRIHRIESRCRTPMHIDSTFIPLAPGKLLVNPEFLDVTKLPGMFKSWDILIPPDPLPPPAKTFSMCSKWIALNVLMLDEERLIVERRQEAFIKALKGWGFKPIPCSFVYYPPFGGAFHCATLDVRRRGTLQSYF